MSQKIIKKSVKDEVEFFCYKWNVLKETDKCQRVIIRAFGVDENNNTVFVNIKNYTPYCWIELPDNINWEKNPKKLENVYDELVDLCCPGKEPISMDIFYKKKLYYAWKKRSDTDTETKYKDILFPFILAKFSSTTHLKFFSYKLTDLQDAPQNEKQNSSARTRKISVPKSITMKCLDGKKIKFPIHEFQNDNPILKLMSARKIPSAGWIIAKGKIIKDKTKCLSRCDIEINCDFKDLFPSAKKTIANPCVLSFDIEAYSSVSSAMPNSEKPEDVIFQISCVKLLKGIYTNYLLSLGNPDPTLIGDNVNLITFKCEAELIIGFKDLIQNEKINVIIGYNILGWDFDYIIKRCRLHSCMDEFSEIGWIKNESAPEVGNGFESKAYGSQKLIYLEAEGILFIDLLPVIKRDYKLQNYRLKTVTTHFKLQTKDPLTVDGIFRCWELNTPKSLSRCGYYCMVDSIITLKLYEKIKMWFGLCEMANTARVPIPYVFSKGTQIQMYSQVIHYCMYNNIVIVSGYRTDPNDELRGAIVLQPIPGNYRKVLCFDFASLYPSIIMAYNIDYSTFVTDPKIPDEHCHVFEWNDHVNCEHDMDRDKKKNGEFSTAKKKVICGIRKFRFIKKEHGGQGVVPSLLEEMLGKRKQTRIEIKQNEENCKRLLKKSYEYKDHSDIKIYLEKIKEEYKDLYSDARLEEIPIDSLKNYNLDIVKELKKELEHILELLLYNNILDKRQLAYKVAANCFPEEDHEILTEFGFMKLKEMIEHFKKEKSLKIACYVEGNLEYHSITEDKIIQQSGSFDLIKFEKKHSNISICATKNHRMWARTEITKNKKKLEKKQYESYTANEIYELGCNKPESIAQFKANFENGYTNDEIYSQSIIKNIKCSLGLDTEDKFDAFLELYGYWLGDGSLNSTTKSIVFYPMKCQDSEYLNKLFKRLELTFFERNKDTNTNMRLTEEGVYIDLTPEKKPISGNKKYESWKTRHLHIIYIQKWWNFFCEEYGNKYVGLNTFNIVLEKAKKNNAKVPLLAVSNVDSEKDHSKDEWIPQDRTVHHSKKRIKLQNDILEWNNKIQETTEDKTIKYNVKSAKWFFRWCFDSLNKNQLKTIFKGLRISDGDQEKTIYHQSTGFSIYTSSLRFSKEISQLAFHSGFSCYTKTRFEIGESRGFNNKGKEFIVTSPALIVVCNELPTQTSPSLDVNKHTSIYKYEGTVWCVSVPTESNIICVRRVYKDENKLIYSRAILTKNSMYGSMGVREGYLPLLPAAMSVTYKGRESIKFISTYIPEKFGGKTVYGDSVTGDTPILIKYENGNIDYKNIEDLVKDENWNIHHENKQIAKTQEILHVWSNIGWTKICSVIKHKNEKNIIRVLTHTGCVDVTTDHSLLLPNGEKTTTNDVEIGTELMHANLPILETPIEKKIEISENTAYAYGLFYAEGSCGHYKTVSGMKYTWAISNANNIVLPRAILGMSDQFSKRGFTFKVLNTIKSSGSNKMVASGKLHKLFVSEFRNKFYDKNGQKKVPIEIINSSIEIKKAFWEGCYAGDKDKDKNKYIRFDNKGKIGSAGLTYIATCLGYPVSLNIRKDKPSIYRMTCTRNYKIQRKSRLLSHRPNKIKKMVSLGILEGFVYDLETENHHFSAGIGRIVVHNTDSAMISFGSDKDHVELTKLADEICDKISCYFLPPMKLEFEKIYWRFLISEKKRYMASVANKYGQIVSFTTKGIILVRRDSCGFAQKIYKTCSMYILENIIETDKKDYANIVRSTLQKLKADKTLKRSQIEFSDNDKQIFDRVNNTLSIVVDGIIKLFTRQYEIKDFVISNALGKLYQNMDLEDYFRTTDTSLLPKNKLPAHVQLGKRMFKRGTIVVSGSRIEYLFTTNLREEKDPNQGDKIEHVDYFHKHNSIYRIDYLYYLQKKAVSPLDDLLNVGIGINGFVNYLYELHRIKSEVCRQIEKMFSSNVILEGTNISTKKRVCKQKKLEYNLID